MRTYLLALGDRALRTAVQATVGLLVATHGTVDWRTIALATGLAVVVSILQSVVDFPALPGGLLTDVTGRALRTFAQSAAGSIGASVLITSVPWPQVLTAAALAAAASVVTSGIATNLGPQGTPDLVALPDARYAGYSGDSRHLRAPARTVPALTAVLTSGVVFAGIGVLGVTAARDTPIRILAAPPAPAALAPPALAAPTAPLPVPPDKSPAYFTALSRNGIPTANDHTALLLIAQSVCTARGSATDAQQTDQIVATFPGRWTHAQAALIVDAAIDQYCP